MKRISLFAALLLLLGLCLCAQAEEEHEHIYEAITDEEYRLYCTICGEVGFAPHEHIYEEITDEEYRVYCMICGEAGFAPHEHVYGEWTATTVARGKETLKKHMVQCEICGHEVIEDHTYKLRPLMVWMNGEYVSAGVHVKRCSKCNDGESIINDIYQKCVDADKEYEVLSDGTRVYVCKGCYGQFGAFSDVVEQDKHKSLQFAHAVSEFQGEYVRESLHGIYCERCNSIQIGYCRDEAGVYEPIDEDKCGRMCVDCREYYDVLDHSVEYYSVSPEEHGSRCYMCKWEFGIEKHHFSWVPIEEDPEQKTHKGYCLQCDADSEIYLHEDADQDNRCDICLWDMPFCMECGSQIKNMEAITYEEREINGITVHVCLCEHGNVYLTHEADEDAFCISVGNDGHMVKCMVYDIAQCNVSGALVPHAESSGYRKDYSGDGSVHGFACDECLVFEGVTPLEAHQAGDGYEYVWNEDYTSSNVHAKVCAYCHEHIPGTEQAHAFEGYMSFFDGSHAPMCTACGYADEAAKEAHTPVYSDKNGWWTCEIDCGVCGALLDYAGHVAKEKGEDLGEGWHFFTCINCGFSGEGYHEGEYTHVSIGDAEYHRSTVDCSICGAKYAENSLHFKNLCSESTCPCGQENAVIAPENAGHEYMFWTDMGDQHITFCNICGAEGWGAEHTYSCTEGVCTECGFETNRGTVVHECGGNSELCGAAG